MAIKHYDAQSWLKEKEARRLKFPAFLFSLFGTVLTCLLAGCLVGVFFRNIFWFCAIGIAVISLLYVLMDRVHLRFYHGKKARSPDEICLFQHGLLAALSFYMGRLVVLVVLVVRFVCRSRQTSVG